MNLTQQEAMSILDAINDDEHNLEEEELLRENNPLLYKAVQKLRKIAYT